MIHTTIFDYQGNPNMLATLTKIDDARNLYLEMKKEKEKFEQLEKLTYFDYVNTIKKNISYPYFFGLKKAQKWLNMCKDESLDKRKKYEEKDHYNFVCRNIEERITNNKQVKVTEILTYGWDYYATEIKFVIPNNDTVFSLTIPNAQNLNSENITYADYGKLRLGYYSSECVNDFIASSYNEDDIKDAFEKYITKEV